MFTKNIVAGIFFLLVLQSWGFLLGTSMPNNLLTDDSSELELNKLDSEVDVPFELEELDYDCYEAGISCKTCNKSRVCYPKHGRFVSVHLENCKTGHTCREGIGCSPDPNPDCAPNFFSCKVLGTFPDPFNCKLYHTCVHPNNSSTALKLHSENCADGYKYNPTSTLCDIPSHESCKYETPRCEYPGYTSELSQIASSYFYICQYVKNEAANVSILYPFLYKCEHGELFINNNCFSSHTQPTGRHPLGIY